MSDTSGRSDLTKFFVAGHALIEEDNRFLLTRRSAQNDYMPFYWDIPGGTVDPGETLEETILREVEEETGLSIIVGPIIHLYSNLSQLPTRQTCQAIYKCRYVDGIVRLNPAEHDSYEWVTFEDMVHLNTMPFLNDYICELGKRQKGESAQAL